MNTILRRARVSSLRTRGPLMAVACGIIFPGQRHDKNMEIERRDGSLAMTVHRSKAGWIYRSLLRQGRTWNAYLVAAPCQLASFHPPSRRRASVLVRHGMTDGRPQNVRTSGPLSPKMTVSHGGRIVCSTNVRSISLIPMGSSFRRLYLHLL